MLKSKSLLVLITCLSIGVSIAQSKKDFQKRFLSAKHYFEVENYAKAYNDFLELSKPHPKNEVERISHYYCGLSAIKLNKLNNANFIIQKALTRFKDWKQYPELQYLSAIVAFERIDYSKAYYILGEIKANSDLKKDIATLKEHYLHVAPTVEVLYDLLCEYEDDVNIAKALAKKLNYAHSSHFEKEMLEYLIQDYRLNRKDYPLGTFKQSKKKPAYNVALMLPLRTQKNSTAHLVKYSKFYEMYEGVKMACEELKAKGIDINLYLYDTKKDSATVARYLNLPEMLKMDLLIGPIYNPGATLAAAFAANEQINYINPLFSNNKLVLGNDNAFLLKPSYLAIGKELAVYASEHFVDRDVLIFYGEDVRDSVMAYEYHHVLDSNYSSHVNFFKIGRDNINDVQKIIKTEDSDLVSHIFVSSTDRLIAANLMSALEEMNMHVPVIAPSRWLDTRIITYEQFVNRHFYFYYDDFIDYDDPKNVIPFRDKFEERMNLKPYSRHAYVGYDCMNYWGNILYQHGNLFNDNLRHTDFSPGKTTFGFVYKEGNTNDVVPLLRFNENYGFEWVNPPKQ